MGCDRTTSMGSPPAQFSAEWKPFVPIYQQLVERYKGEILEHRLRAGDRVDSISDIQSKYRVARETAKRVLKTLAQEGYIVQRAGKGSFVADLRPPQKVWGAVFPFYSIHYEDLIERLSGSASAMQRELRHFCDNKSWEEEVRLVGMLLNERYEAVIVVPTLDESRTWNFYSRLSPADSPVILLDHTMSYRDFDFVIQSYDLGVVRAMEYLLDQKDGGVALVENRVWADRNMVRELMRETYRIQLEKRRPACEPLILECSWQVSAEDLRRQGITGLLCCDDIAATRAIGRLREQGAAVPEEFSVVSYGNTDLARFFTPSITSVDPHNDELADALVALLRGYVMGKPRETTQTIVQPELVIRET